MTKYGIEERIIRPAPEITAEDVIAQSEAWEVLDVRHQTLIQAINRGRYTVVWDLERDGSGRRSARMLLRSEIEAAARGESTPGGASYRVPPEIEQMPGDDTSDAAYGIEERVVRPAPEITGEDVMTQTQAVRLLEIAKPTLINAMNRGKFTVVWDLERDGSGRRSARMLLRSEVEAAARGELDRKPVNYRMPPVADDE